ncbi:MAG: DUF4294 domain-containing protein [Rikenellaceae bacterium]
MFRFLIKCGAILLSVLSFEITGYSQDKGYALGYKLEGNDTVYQIKIKELYLFSRPKNRKNAKEWREYYRLIYNFKKTYPYALLAREKINEADSILESRHFSNREREKYIKSVENQLFRDFEKPLRKMTFSQGKLLLKLIDREVGQSSFYLIKNYRGGFTAGFWQGVAKIFGSDLKQPYDKFGSDRLTEELVIMYQNGSFDYLYYSLYN